MAPMPRSIASLMSHLRLAGERIAALSAPRRVGYIGSYGAGNLGDDAAYLAARELLRQARPTQYAHPTVEARLRRLGLSGAGYFSQVILGGGTLINPSAVEVTRSVLRLGIPMWSLGTGVGGWGYGMSARPDIREWAPLLAGFEGIGVRGPRSKAALEEIGVSRAEVVGDLALALALDQAMPCADPPRFAVNVIRSSREDGCSWTDEGLADALCSAARVLEGQGFRAVLVGMHEDDRAPLARLAARLGRPAEPVHVPRSPEQFFGLVGPCVFSVCVRLHAAVLSTCAGVPPLVLAYRDKNWDFVDSMELETWCLTLDRVEERHIQDATLGLASQAAGLRVTTLARAHVFRNRLRDYVGSLAAAAEGATPTA